MKKLLWKLGLIKGTGRGEGPPCPDDGLLSHQTGFTRPPRVGIEASTVCQLRCRTCPTAHGLIRRHLGNGFLSPSDFERFLDRHPYVRRVELSNWGEALLNPRLADILHIAGERKVAATLGNGVNLNTAGDELLEALVKYRVKTITCSIDGASRETYSIYRVSGDFDRVIRNIRKINDFKKAYRSGFPGLTWQFVAFGHNQHEIDAARKMAEELNMNFKLKLSWADMYYEDFSPVTDQDGIRTASVTGVADRKEYEAKYKKNMVADCCKQLWLSPKINWDGRVLGCCVNYWADYGNAFKDGLESCLSSERMAAARRMLTGSAASRDDIPCLQCKVYQSRVELGTFVSPDETVLDDG